MDFGFSISIPAPDVFLEDVALLLVENGAKVNFKDEGGAECSPALVHAC